jgi:alpha-L-glutamate ligase-like protein
MRISYFYELKNIQEKLRNYSNFVIKPSSGSGGNGIIVINDYKDDVWISVSSKKYDFADITKHVADIIFGVYSFGLNDTAIIEERIIQNEQISKISPYGLADVRVINYKGQNVKAMLRIATLSSGGKANLHQGGIGVAIDLKSGVSFNAQQERQDIKYHPDTGISLLNVKVPYWKELLSLCEKTAKAIPMEYLGIDVAIGENGPLILEVNARPGIEIQNISHSGMLKDLNKIDYKGLA